MKQLILGLSSIGLLFSVVVTSCDTGKNSCELANEAIQNCNLQFSTNLEPGNCDQSDGADRCVARCIANVQYDQKCSDLQELARRMSEVAEELSNPPMSGSGGATGGEGGTSSGGMTSSGGAMTSGGTAGMGGEGGGQLQQQQGGAAGMAGEGGSAGMPATGGTGGMVATGGADAGSTGGGGMTMPDAGMPPVVGGPFSLEPLYSNFELVQMTLSGEGASTALKRRWATREVERQTIEGTAVPRRGIRPELSQCLANCYFNP